MIRMMATPININGRRTVFWGYLLALLGSVGLIMLCYTVFSVRGGQSKPHRSLVLILNRLLLLAYLRMANGRGGATRPKLLALRMAFARRIEPGLLL